MHLHSQKRPKLSQQDASSLFKTNRKTEKKKIILRQPLDTNKKESTES